MPDRSTLAQKIVLYDSSPLSRMCILAGLQAEQDMEIIGVGSIAQLKEQGNLDILLINCDVAGLSGQDIEELIVELREIWPSVLMLLLCNDNLVDELCSAPDLQIDGLITNTVQFQIMAEAINLLSHGFSVYPEQFRIDRLASSDVDVDANAVVRDNMHDLPAIHSPKFDLLTPRQREVLHLLARGDANKVIARKLDISESTVKVHLRGIMMRFGVDNRTQVVAHFLASADMKSAQIENSDERDMQ